MLKTTNADSTPSLGKESQSAGTSFFEVLAGTSALSTAASGPSTALASPLPAHTNSDANAQDEQADAKPDANTESQELTQSNIPQSRIIFSNQPAALAQSLSSQTLTRSSSNTANRSADHPQRSQSLTAQSSANSTTPSDPSVAQQAVAMPAPVEIPAAQQTAAVAVQTNRPSAQQAVIVPMPVRLPSMQQVALATTIMPTVSSPEASVSGTEKTAAQNPEPSAATQVMATDTEHQAISAEQVETGSQNKPETSASKTSKPALHPDAATAPQSTDRAPSELASSGANGISSSPNAAAALTLPADLILPDINLMPQMSDLNQMANKATQTSKASDANMTKLADATAGADAKKTSESQSQAGAANASDSSSNIASGNQGAQRTQADPSQPVSVTPKAADTGASQITTQASAQLQAIAAHGATHDASVPNGHGDGVADAVRASGQTAQTETAENASTSAINTANVIQKMSETEMHVGMRSADFGEVSIRTLVSQQQMTAQISVDHSDLGKAISAHIPAMEAKLGGDLGVRALVEVNQSGMSFSGERGFSSQRDQRSFTQPAQAQNTPVFAEADPSGPQVAATAAGSEYRLDIRA